MQFHHVLVSLKSEPKKFRCILADLSQEDLVERFLKPYRRGENISSNNGTTIPLSQIRKLRIVRTERESTAERNEMRKQISAEIDNFNKHSDTVVLFNMNKGNSPDDVMEIGEDVTTVIIAGPLGRE